MARFAILALVALVSGGAGFLLGGSDAGGGLAEGALRSVTRRVAEAAAGRTDVDSRMRILIEYPEIARHISTTGGFGGKHSRVIAMDMFTFEGPGIEEAKELAEIVEVAPRSWLIRLPIVNAVLFETDAGLVLVDTGMGVGGPAILEQIRSVSDAPIHTIIYTHGHVDHAYGTWALTAEGPNGGSPEIVAHEGLPLRFERYIQMRGSLASYMSQPRASLPKSADDLVWPTLTFRDRLELDIGGEKFVLVHHEGETDDQLYVWLPGRKTLASADYYQGFLPNAGNGKRVQRNVAQWVVALREMVALEPQYVLPAHGDAIDDPATIRENFDVLADTLEHILDHTIEGLNAGLRKDEIAASVKLPERLANHPTMDIQYVTPNDVSKMIIKRHTGWWDDIPSNWTPAPLQAHGAAIASLAGMDALIARARALIDEDIQLACHLTDWAFFAEPSNPAVQELVLEVYRARILHPDSNVQEILAYLKSMAQARDLQIQSDS